MSTVNYENNFEEIQQSDLNDDKYIENIHLSKSIFNEILDYVTNLKSEFIQLVKGREVLFKKDKFDNELSVPNFLS